MATSSQREPTTQSPRTLTRRQVTGLGLGLVLATAACRSVRPLVKIGLLAPFEGLYRQTGYDALAAMRAAIAAQEHAEESTAAILPLALDDAGDPARCWRAARKLLADPAVQAVVGPLTPATAAAVTPLLAGHGVPHLLPFAPPGAADEWARELVGAVAAAAAGGGSAGLILAGERSGWPAWSGTQWTAAVGSPVRLNEAQSPVGKEEAILWLGSPAAGARYLATLRALRPDVPFWLSPASDDPVFPRLAGEAAHGPLYAAAWLDADYPAWAADHPPAAPAPFQVYQATRAAIARLTGRPAIAQSWRLFLFRLEPEGGRRLLATMESPRI